jgi:hypothetical protein
MNIKNHLNYYHISKKKLEEFNEINIERTKKHYLNFLLIKNKYYN